MPKPYRGHKFILCVIDEMTNYLITMPIYQARSEEIGDSLIDNLVEAWYSLEQYIGLKEDKLSSTTLDFISSEGNLETKCLYWFRKPKLC